MTGTIGARAPGAAPAGGLQRAAEPGDGLEPDRAAPDYVDLFEHAPVGYLLLDDNGAIEKINQTGAAMLGWQADWLVGKPFSRWVVNNDKQLFAAHQRELRDCAQCASQALRIKNRQGQPVSLRLESTRAPPGDGPARSRSIMLDVSGDERFARRLRHLQAQLTHVARLRTAGELASSLAHELNQPLGIIRLNCDAALRLLAAGDSGGDAFAQALTQTRESASFASDIVRHLRSFLRDSSQGHCVCALENVIRDVATLIEVAARDSDILLALDIEANLPAVRIDAVQIKQVLLNLAYNSIEAIAQARRGIDYVTLRAARCGRAQILISVIDTGPGFGLARLERPFDAFYTTKADGMGLGLSISRTIVAAHGGTLWIAREVGQGATVHLRLPAIDEPRDDD